MKRIAHIITGLSTGGAEAMLCKLIDGLDRPLYEHSVISLTGCGTLGKTLEACGVPVYAEDLKNGNSVLSSLRIARIVRRVKPDIIQGWMYHGNVFSYVGRLIARRRCPVVWNVRQCLYDFSFEKRSTARVIRVGAMMSRFVDGIIYNTQTSADHHEAVGYAKQKTAILPNGFDCEIFQPSERKGFEFRQLENIGGDEVVIGMVGRFHAVKGCECFLKAAGKIAKEMKNVTFLLVGNGFDEGNEKLIKMVYDAGVRDRVRLLGERMNMENIYPAFDIFVSPSLSEGFSNAIGEAMACGVPCVVSDVGESAKLVSGVGIVFKPADHDALAKACTELIRMHHESRRTMGMAARKRIQDEYSIGSVCKRYDEYYESLMCSRYRHN